MARNDGDQSILPLGKIGHWQAHAALSVPPIRRKPGILIFDETDLDRDSTNPAAAKEENGDGRLGFTYPE
jgi:hypothetical protein